MKQRFTLAFGPRDHQVLAAGLRRCMRLAFASRLPMSLLLAGLAISSSFSASAQILERKLLAPDMETGDYLGLKVALVPGWAFCAAPGDDDVQTQSGAVYVYRATGADWGFVRKLKASDPSFGGYLGGHGMAASGDWMVATTPFDRPPGGYDVPGSAHVYNLQGGNWVHAQKLLASDYTSIYQKCFGMSAALRGNRMAIGEWEDQTMAYQAGSAYVFELQGGTWVEAAKVYASDFEVSGAFGFAVAIDGDRLAVGAPEHDNGGPDVNPGAVYVFERQVNGTWLETQKLVASDAANQNHFGSAVAMSGDTILVGTSAHNHTPQLSGAIYFFTRQGPSFVQTQEFCTWDNQAQDGIGGRVSIEGDLALISSNDRDMGLAAGAAYALRRLNGTWQQIGKVFAPDGVAGDAFSGAVAISGQHALIAAPTDDDACPANVACQSGSAYVFELAPDATQLCACPSQGPCANNDNFGGCKSSRGMGGVLAAAGSSSVQDSTLSLQATSLPANALGIFLMGSGSSTLALGDGQLCIGGASIYRFKLAQSAGPSGVLRLGANIARRSINELSPAGWITPGSTWNFQAWFRDNQGPCGHGSNLTSSVRVVFRP
ncbi:MAG TPA: FG-GAP repeat protein [Planctomycetota bacterium]|nr:FG-GAP repeat protein [Planctomycetota bacterium]